jgi:hypothetical protein
MHARPIGPVPVLRARRLDQQQALSNMSCTAAAYGIRLQALRNSTMHASPGLIQCSPSTAQPGSAAPP